MTNKKLIVFLWTVVLTICSYTNSIAQDQGAKDVAETINQGNSISWVIKVPYQSATLTVSAPDGKVYRQEFAAGAPITFSLFTGRGENYPSGKFNYELVLAPVLPAEVKKALRESRREGKSKQVETEFRQKGVLPEPMIDFGTFTVMNGIIIKGNESETEPEPVVQNQPDSVRQTVKTPNSGDSVDKGTIALEDQVISDDLIVDGSVCIGFDCMNGEIFGSDTLRLKENNLRIHFDDTSTLDGVPNNDWRIVANDSTNGGANRFSIEDATAGTIPFTIKAEAPSNSLYVASTGRIGLRTSTPVLDVHVLTTNTPAFRLDQSSAGGFTAQIWDIGGNEANFFVRDVTSGSRLPFRIRPGAPTSSIDIAADGDVGMGTSAPKGPLEINRTPSMDPPEMIEDDPNRLLLLDRTGKLSVKSFLETKSGGVIFPDGTIQTTAATSGSTGGGTTPGDTGMLGYLGPNYSTHFIGGNGTLKPNSPANVRVDPVTNAIGVASSGGNVAVRFNVATNLNLADTTAAFVVYKIRYRDGDGNGAGARVLVDVFANNIDTGAVTNDVVFDSNAFPSTGTGFSTVTVCRPANTVFYNFAFHGTWIESRLSAASSGGVFGSTGAMADLAHIQVYKSATCP